MTRTSDRSGDGENASAGGDRSPAEGAALGVRREGGPAPRLDAVRLGPCLAGAIPGFGTSRGVETFAGGRSTPTFLLELPCRTPSAPRTRPSPRPGCSPRSSGSSPRSATRSPISPAGWRSGGCPPRAPSSKGLGGLDRAALGIPHEEATVEACMRRRALSTPPHWRFAVAFPLLRLAAIPEGVCRRALDGNACKRESGLKTGDTVPVLARPAAGEIAGT